MLNLGNLCVQNTCYQNIWFFKNEKMIYWLIKNVQIQFFLMINYPIFAAR